MGCPLGGLKANGSAPPPPPNPKPLFCCMLPSSSPANLPLPTTTCCIERCWGPLRNISEALEPYARGCWGRYISGVMERVAQLMRDCRESSLGHL